MNAFKVDNVSVEVYPTRAEMGRAAAKDIQEKIVELLKTQPFVNVIFAAAPSQNEVLQALVEAKDVPWERVRAFHMDEYIGLPSDAPQAFGRFLNEHIFSHLPFAGVEYIDATAKDAEAEALRYASVLERFPADVVVMGIGENGHVAFNDPPVADFQDRLAVKTVKLDEVCRRQQVNDGCFEDINDVPRYAITLTVPTLLSAKWVFCIVPAKSKAKAVKDTLFSPIGEHCPATALRNKPYAKLYLDKDSASMI